MLHQLVFHTEHPMTTIPDTAEIIVRASHVPGPFQGQWTYDDYEALPDDGNRYEIIDGVLYFVPTSTPNHQNNIALIIARLVVALDDTGRGQVFASPDVHVGSSVLRPDVVVVLTEHAGVIAQKNLIGPPDLVIEVASPSTAAYDCDAVFGKRGAYARAGIAEYWLVDPQQRTIEVLTLRDDTYTSLGIFQGDDQIQSQIVTAAVLIVRSCFPRVG
jgi:Uma2 family endonuclease